MKNKKSQTANKLSTFIDIFAKIHNSEQINKMEMERKDTALKVIQPAENMDTECNERPPQSKSNKTIDNGELHKQTHKTISP